MKSNLSPFNDENSKSASTDDLGRSEDGQTSEKLSKPSSGCNIAYHRDLIADATKLLVPENLSQSLKSLMVVTAFAIGLALIFPTAIILFILLIALMVLYFVKTINDKEERLESLDKQDNNLSFDPTKIAQKRHLLNLNNKQ